MTDPLSFTYRLQLEREINERLAKLNNQQLGNMGNKGDVPKHKVLPELAEMLASHSGGCAYVDPFAFLLQAPHPTTGRRRRAVKPPTRQGLYRCGVGRVLDALVERLELLILAETDGSTREILFRQLKLEGFAEKLYPDRQIIVDAEQLASIRKPDPLPSSVLALVDPFKIEDSPWKKVCDGLSLFSPAEIPHVWVLYTNTRELAYDWRTLDPNPTGFGLVLAGRLSKNYGGSAGGKKGGVRKYHNLAVFTTRAELAKAQAILLNSWGPSVIHS